MTPPPEIHFSQIDLGTRGRTQYHGIEQLAGLIEDNGLIQPLVLVPLEHIFDEVEPKGCLRCGIAFWGYESPVTYCHFGLDAGGRRYKALELLLAENVWDGVLHHAATSLYNPLRPGYVLKGEAFTSPFQRAMTELAENLGRQDPDWRDQVKMIVNAWRLAQREKHAAGESIIMRDFGAMIGGVEYMQVQAAIAVHDDLITNPEKYRECTSIRGAQIKMLKEAEAFVTKLQASRLIGNDVKHLVVPDAATPSVKNQSELEPLGEAKPFIIPLSNAFVLGDSLTYMESLNAPTFDHIITDPDYAVSIERLGASMSTAHLGVEQETITDSLADFRRFIPLAWKVLKEQGFLVFFYDLDHHEKLQAVATSVGFAVQRWPLIWVKTDYRSNAATAFNFTKNFEVAMVCRKPNAVLSQVQNSSVFNCTSGQTVREFNHPFAKPLDVTKWILSAVAIKGQTIYDPFMGSGAICCAAAEWGLKPLGSEINPERYANAIMNLQRTFKKLVGGNVTFS